MLTFNTSYSSSSYQNFPGLHLGIILGLVIMCLLSPPSPYRIHFVVFPWNSKEIRLWTTEPWDYSQSQRVLEGSRNQTGSKKIASCFEGTKYWNTREVKLFRILRTRVGFWIWDGCRLHWNYKRGNIRKARQISF